MVGWSLLLASIATLSVSGVVLRPSRTPVSVTAYGAVGDGISDSTEAFRHAINGITASGSRGTVEVPAGVYVTGPLRLASGVTLLLRDGATLRANDVFARYPVIDPLPSYGRGREGSAVSRREAFLSADGAQDVSIVGEGSATIDGSGRQWWEWRFLPATAADRTTEWDNITLPHLIELRNTQNVVISGLNLRDSPLWNVHLFACKSVSVKNLDIRVTPQQWSPSALASFAKPRKSSCSREPVAFRPYNTDGIVPDSSEDVTIENIVYDGGDDVVAIKSGWDCYGESFGRPSRGITVRNVNVQFTRASAIVIGSEMSGGVADVDVQGLTVKCSDVGAVIVKSAIHRGGFVRNISIKDVQVGNMPSALHIVGKVGKWTPTPNPGCVAEGEQPRVRPPVIENFNFANVEQLPGTMLDSFPIQIGQEAVLIRDLVLSSVNVQSPYPGLCTNAVGAAVDTTLRILNPRTSSVTTAHNLPEDGSDCEL